MAEVNTVLEGRCKGYNIIINKNCLSIGGDLKKSEIASYTVIDETTKDEYSVWKGALGATLFGDMGAIAGIGGKKTKEYLVAIEWVYPKNSKNNKSLILLDEKHYKVFVQSML